MSELNDFQLLLEKLQEIDNESRSAAEKAYESIDGVKKLTLLLQYISDGTRAMQNRVFSGLLCRRLLDSSYDETFRALDTNAQQMFRQQILQMIIDESIYEIRKRLAEIASEIAKKHVNDETGDFQWPEFVQFIFATCLEASQLNDDLRMIALQMFANVPNLFGQNYAQHLNGVAQVLEQCMKQPEMSPGDTNALKSVMNRRQMAVKAFTSFVVHQFDNSEDSAETGAGTDPRSNKSALKTRMQREFEVMMRLIPHMIQAVADNIIIDESDDTLMKCLVEIAESASDFLKTQINSIINLCLQILENDGLSDLQKHLAIEVFVVLAENSTNPVRKFQHEIAKFVQRLLKMMTDVEEDEEWNNVDEEEEEDETANHVTAEMALDRFACAMKGEWLFKEIIKIVPQMLQSNRWQDRVGGLMAISATGEGLEKAMSKMIENIVNFILPLLNDPHPRVQYAACNAIGQIASDFEPKFQKSCHETVLPALIGKLDTVQFPRVQAHAGAAMVNFFEGTPKSITVKYLPSIASKLYSVMSTQVEEMNRTGRKLVLEQIITTVAAVADSVSDKFAPYYDNFMPLLKFLMQNLQNQPKFRLMRGKTVECISLIGLAVGKEKFTGDAQDVMNMLMKVQNECMGNAASSGGETDTSTVKNAGAGKEPNGHNSLAGDSTQGGDNDEDDDDELGADDPQINYMISAWARICKLIGKDFEPFLPMVMGPVMKAASNKPDVCVLYNDEIEDVETDPMWRIVKIGEDQNFAIKTSGLEDKATACQMLVCYARELKEGFANYAVQVSDLMISLLKFYFNDEVRSAAADSLPYLLVSSVPLGPDTTKMMWNNMLEALMSALESEPETQQMSDLFESLSECIKKMGYGCLQNEHVTKLLELSKKHFDDVFENQQNRVTKRSAADFDEDEEEDLEHSKNEDDMILGRLTDVMQALFEAYKVEAIPIFQQILPNVMRLQEPGRPWTYLNFAMCFWTSLIEFTGELSLQFRDMFLQPMLDALQHEEADVRQGAVFGIGLMAMHGGTGYDDVISKVTPHLIQLVQTEGSRSENLNLSTENAISALTKIAKFRPNCLNTQLDNFLKVWMSWLPVWEDVEETPHVYGFLCDQIEANNQTILGPENSNVVGIIKVIATTLNKDGVPEDSECYGRLLKIVKTIQANQEFFLTCVASLSLEEQQSLQKFLATSQ